MLSALVPPVGRKPAVPLAGQLAQESYVRPGHSRTRDMPNTNLLRLHRIGTDIPVTTDKIGQGQMQPYCMALHVAMQIRTICTTLTVQRRCLAYGL